MKVFQKKSIFLVLIFCLFSLTGYSQSAASEEDQITNADSLWQLSEYDKAIIIYENIPADYPDKQKFRQKLVKAYAYLGMFDKAEERAGQLYNGGIGENCRLGLIYTMQNRTQDALKAVDNMMLDAEPGQYFPGAPTCAMYFETPAGEYEKAADKIYKIIEQAPGLTKLQFMLYAIYLERQLGNREKGNILLKQLDAEVNKLWENGVIEQTIKMPTGFKIYKSLAAYYALKGEDEMALDYLQKNVENGGRQYYWIKNVSPFFAQYKDNPRFMSIMEDMKVEVDKMKDNVEAQLLSK